MKQYHYYYYLCCFILLFQYVYIIESDAFVVVSSRHVTKTTKNPSSTRWTQPLWKKNAPHTSSSSSALSAKVSGSIKNVGSWIMTSAVAAVPSSPAIIEALSITISVFILAGYHIKLVWKEEYQKQQQQTWRQYQADTRERWSRHVRETESWLYAIQALRNAITAQTFLATTVLSLLTLITGRMWELLRSTSIPSFERRLFTIQLTSIAVPMLFSAYQFLQGVRLMTHAGFMFPVGQKDDTRVDKIMRQTQNCQWLGLRWMYISLGPIFWVIGGSRAFLISAILLLLFFRSIDKQPQSMNYEQFQGVDI